MEANSAVETIARIVDLAPAAESRKIRNILSEVLLAVSVQQPVVRRGGGQIIVNEILTVTPAVSSLIEAGQYSQLVSVMQTSRDEGMRTLDQSLKELVRTGEVSYEEALAAAIDKDSFRASNRGI